MPEDKNLQTFDSITKVVLNSRSIEVFSFNIIFTS